MDRTGPRLLLLILTAGLVSAAAPDTIPIRAARWIDPQQRFAALSSQPEECAKPQNSAQFEIGRAAFRTPALLGGQAARAGLKCESCHSNGRRNAAFLFQGLSGAPGTADVTSSLMSSHRGNGSFDPKPIPDLAYPVKVSRDPGNRALETFIHGLIVEEFDGAEPPPLILNALAAYVRAIDAAHCAASASDPIELAGVIDTVRRTVRAAGSALQQDDRVSARLLLAGARSMLGEIDERFAGEELSAERAHLRAADGELFGIQQAIDRKAADVGLRLVAWQAGIPEWSASLLRAERRSLYDRRRLAWSLR